MKTIEQSTAFGINFAGMEIAVPTFYLAVHAQDNTFSGTVKRVCSNGFRLNTGDRTFTVDSWDICGDNTASHLSADEQVDRPLARIVNKSSLPFTSRKDG